LPSIVVIAVSGKFLVQPIGETQPIFDPGLGGILIFESDL
jgi:hypothetical protein